MSALYLEKPLIEMNLLHQSEIYIKKTNYSLNIYPLNTFEFRGGKMTKEKKGLGWPCH